MPDPQEPLNESDRAAEPAAGLSLPALLNRHMRYPNAYAWLLLLSALDVMLTWVLLHFPEGYEANPIAAAVIDRWGLEGMVVYKFVLITVFILICEGVGSLRDTTGRALSRISLLIAAVPVVWSLFLLSRFAMNSL